MNNEEAINKLSDITGMTYSDEQKDILNSQGGICIMASAGSGKALADYTNVLTPDGYRAICTLKVGDKVYGVDGKTQTVTGVFPQGKKNMYDVHFSDGNKIPCCKNHLWTVSIDNNKYQTMELKDILQLVSSHNIQTPVTQPVEFKNNSSLSVDPYLMGVWINSGVILEDMYILAIEDAQVRQTTIDKLQRMGETPNTDKYKFDLSDSVITQYYNKDSNFIEALKEICEKYYNKHIYFKNEIELKFIPLNYLHSSIENRLSLIKGIIDSNSHTENGKVEIKVTRKQLAKDIVSLAESLGMVVEVQQERDKSRYFLVTYTIILSIPKYLHNYFGKDSLTGASRQIVKIENINVKEHMTCIKVSNEDGLFLTEHCIVTHNTTVLTHLIAKRCLTGEIEDVSKLLCTTYSNAGKIELKDKLSQILSKIGITGTLNIKTIHATYYNILKNFNIPIQNICTEGKKLQLIDESLKELKLRLDEDDKETLSSLISYQVNNLMTDNDLIQSSAYTLENFTLANYTAVRTEYNKKKQQLGLTDFDDLQMYMYMLMVKQENQSIIDYCRKNYKYVYVDEFQDTSKIQFAILRKMVENPDNLVVIGDDDQSIYSWRGADPSIIINICGYFDITKYILSTNYRCCGEIVKLAAEGIKHNTNRVSKEMKPYNKGGKLQLCDTPNSLWGITRDVYTHIKSLIDNGEKPEDIVVLCRNNRQATILSNILVDNEVYYKASTDTMKFTKLPVYKDIKAMYELVDSDMDIAVTKQLLWKLVSYLGIRGTSVITFLMENCSVSLRDSLWHIIMECFPYTANITKKHRTAPKIPVEIATKVRGLAQSYLNKSNMQSNLITLYEALCLDTPEQTLNSLFDLYRINAGFMYKNPDKNRLLEGVMEYAKYKVTIYGITKSLQLYHRAEMYDNGTSLYDDSVELSTIHGAKGREWKHVILLADDNISFPNLTYLKTMKERGIMLENINQWIDEERRLHYVAFTRAKDELTIFAKSKNVSLFALECLGKKDIDNEFIRNLSLQSNTPPEIENFSKECFQKYRYDITKERVNVFQEIRDKNIKNNS